MSYRQAMRWTKRHPKGTHQPVIMSTGSGVWPAQSWIEHDWWPYMEACKATSVQPMKQEDYYRRASLRGSEMSSMDIGERVEFTKAENRNRKED
mgnify:CR=1 FL=1